jgi:hypothetical protein
MLQKKAEDLTAEDDIEDRARPDNKKWQESAQIKETVLAHEEQQMWRKLSMVWKGEHTIISAKSLEYFEPFTVGVLSNIVSHCGTSREFHAAACRAMMLEQYVPWHGWKHSDDFYWWYEGGDQVYFGRKTLKKETYIMYWYRPYKWVNIR